MRVLRRGPCIETAMPLVHGSSRFERVSRGTYQMRMRRRLEGKYEPYGEDAFVAGLSLCSKARIKAAYRAARRL